LPIKSGLTQILKHGNGQSVLRTTLITYSWPSGAGAGVTADVTRNWEHHFTNAVITPTISGLTRIGKQNLQLQAGPMIPISAAPGERPDFGVRAAITFVLPRK